MIVSGGVNIYPQEIEDVLLLHPEVADVAVFGVPDAEMGEEVKAVVQPAPGVAAGPELEAEIIGVLPGRPVALQVPPVGRLQAELPRGENGKLYKRVLRDATGRDTSPVCSEPSGRRSAPLIYARSR